MRLFPFMRPKRTRLRGFSLIELLLVCVIVSFLGGVLYSTFYQGVSLWKRARDDRGEFRDAFFVEKITADLRNAIRLEQRTVMGKKGEFEFFTLVPAASLGIKDTSALHFPCRVRYYFEQDGRRVIRETQTYSQVLTGETAAFKSSVVFENIRSLEMRYYGQAKNKAILWQKSWKKECLPHAVKLSMEYTDQTKPFVRYIRVPAGGCGEETA